MFTGLVTDVGRVTQADHQTGLTRFTVQSSYPVERIEMGASIMHSGVCLTVVEFGAADKGAWWVVEAVPETLARSILGGWADGSRVNLEQSLRLGDELGGHFVFGHVDGVAEIVAVVEEGGSYRVRIRPPADIAKYFAAKGSVAVDGVSLTVAQTYDDGDFDVAIIPHTWEVTTLGDAAPGRNVNLEVDMLARYVARMLGRD